MARSVSRKKSRKKVYRPRYFYISLLPLFSEVWETFTEKLTKDEINIVIRHAAATGEYLAARVYDYQTDTLLITYRFVTKKQKEEIQEYEQEIKDEIEREKQEEIEKQKRKVRRRKRKKPVAKKKPVSKKEPERKPSPVKKKVKRKVKKDRKEKKKRIHIKRKKYSTQADLEDLPAYEIYKYVKRKIEENFLVRFVFKVRQPSPKTAMLIKQKKMKRQKEYYITTSWWNFRTIEDANRFIAMRGMSYDEVAQIYYMPKR